MKEKFTAWRKVSEDGKAFYYMDWGSETHGRRTFRLWISSTLLEFRNEDRSVGFLYLPCSGVDVVQTEKGTLILKKGEFNLFNIFVRAGFRGRSEIEILTEAKLILPYAVYHSERGSLGISMGSLVLTRSDTVRWRWRRTGRLYGSSPRGVSVINLDGKVQDFEDVEDLEDLREVET